MSHLNIVSLTRDKWANSKCTCCSFLKDYICFHIMAVAVNEKLLFIPDNFKKIEIITKKKRGRKAKAKKALEHQT